MKILQTNLFLTPRQSYQIVPYKKQENKPDTFVKNTNKLSFMGNDEFQNPYQEVLQRPELVQKVMELVTTAATILVGKAAGINFKKDDSDIDIDIICKSTAKEQNQNDTYSQEIEKLKEENDLLRKLLVQKETAQSQQEISINSFATDNDIVNVEPVENVSGELDVQDQSNIELSEEQNYEFVFPKKRVGILSKSQKDLKSITTGLSLNQEQCEKLTLICKELLQNGSHLIDDEIVDNKQLTNDLVNKLTVSTPNDISQVIDEFYEKCELKPKVDEVSEIPKTEIFEPTGKKLPGVTVVGKIDLDSIKDRKRKKPASAVINENDKSEYVYTRTEKRPRIKKPASTEDEAIDTSLFEKKDKNVSIFRIPGTVNKDVTVDLRHLLLKFQQHIKKDIEKPRYQNNKCVSVKVFPSDVLDELSKNSYRNINKKNIEEIADSINADPRFHKMFTLHAAMRLIDRFADFDSDVTIEKQCHDIIDTLEHVLQKSFKNGTEVRKYKDKGGFIGARLFFPEESYDEAAEKIFGSYQFGLGVCEYQPTQVYFDKRIKQPLICTIFIKGEDF